MEVVTACVLANHDAEHCCENTKKGAGLKNYLEEKLDAYYLFSSRPPSTA